MSQTNPTASGLFATARRGGLTGDEIREIGALRSGPRPVPYRVLADRYGRCEADIRAVMEPTPRADNAPADNDDQPPTLTFEDYRRAERMSRRHPFWTPEKDRSLRKMWVDLWMPASQCGEALGVSTKVIESRLQTLGITRLDRFKAA